MTSVPCPANDGGQCTVPEVTPGQFLVVRMGELVLATAADLEELSPTDWDMATWRATSAVSLTIDEGIREAVEQSEPTVADSLRGTQLAKTYPVAAVYVVCQPCGHAWVAEPGEPGK